MDRSVRAVWYDLPDDISDSDREAYLRWLHDEHLPKVQAIPGIAWAAHYEIKGGGSHMNEISERLQRAGEDVPTGSQFVVMTGAASPYVYFNPHFEEVEPTLTDDAPAMLALRQNARPCVFIEEARCNGPEYDQKVDCGTPGPAIQMGSFRTEAVEDENDLAAWYAQYRFPAMTRMPGSIMTRKMVSVTGWAKHSVMYEFTSLEARKKGFEETHEALALDENVWTNKIITYTVHSPGSPSVAQRIWPEVTD